MNDMEKHPGAPVNCRDVRVVAIFFQKTLKLLAITTITIMKVL
jgi:hypothetical protein